MFNFDKVLTQLKKCQSLGNPTGGGGGITPPISIPSLISAPAGASVGSGTSGVNGLLGVSTAGGLKGMLSSGASSMGNLLFGGGLQGNLGNTIGAGMNLVSNLLPQPKEYAGKSGNITKGMDSAYDTIQSIAGKLGPYGRLVSLGMGANKLLGKGVKALGGGTDGMTKTDAILGSAFMQMTPLGMINGFGGKTSDTISMNNQTWNQMGSSYGGSMNDMLDSLLYSGKKYGLLSHGGLEEANAIMAENGRRLNRLNTMANDANMAYNVAANQTGIASNAYDMQMAGGYNLMGTYAARQGMKILRARRIASKMKVGGMFNKPSVEPFEFNTSAFNPKPFKFNTQVFKLGGAMNVIPEGSLHARLHHMENDEDITKKGIPVVTEEHGETILQAEIEVNEIIFNKEVTDKLEKWFDEFLKEDTKQTRKDEIAIEAGKLLAKEIMENTDDRTGLIDQV